MHAHTHTHKYTHIICTTDAAWGDSLTQANIIGTTNTDWRDSRVDRFGIEVCSSISLVSFRIEVCSFQPETQTRGLLYAKTDLSREPLCQKRPTTCVKRDLRSEYIYMYYNCIPIGTITECMYVCMYVCVCLRVCVYI